MVIMAILPASLSRRVDNIWPRSFILEGELLLSNFSATAFGLAPASTSLWQTKSVWLEVLEN